MGGWQAGPGNGCKEAPCQVLAASWRPAITGQTDAEGADKCINWREARQKSLDGDGREARPAAKVKMNWEPGEEIVESSFAELAFQMQSNGEQVLP